jgi:hypothetical protein
MADFKPNIYPIMYWGLMYGLIAGFVLFILLLMSRFVTLLWFPVFLVGVIWGGYRNYKKQKSESGHMGTKPKTALEEFKEAARDIVGATREMVAEQAQEAVAGEEAAMATTQEEADVMDDEAGADLVNENDALVEQAPVEDEIVPVPPATVVAPPTPPITDNRSNPNQSVEDQSDQSGQTLNK